MVKKAYSKWVKVNNRKETVIWIFAQNLSFKYFCIFVPLGRMSNIFRLTHKIFLVVFSPNNRLSQRNYNRGK